MARTDTTKNHVYGDWRQPAGGGWEGICMTCGTQSNQVWLNRAFAIEWADDHNAEEHPEVLKQAWKAR